MGLETEICSEESGTARHQTGRSLLLRWLNWETRRGREESIKRATEQEELLVAEFHAKVVGFIHYVLHEDIIDGDLNAFITAFYVTPSFRGKGVGSLLLKEVIEDSLSKGAAGVETSTIYREAKKFYEKRGFKQVIGDIGEVFLELDVQECLRPGKHRLYIKGKRWQKSIGSCV